MALHQASGRWRRGLMLALVTAACWATLPVALKLTLEQVDPITLTWFRFVFAACVIGGWLAAGGGLRQFAQLKRGGWSLLVTDVSSGGRAQLDSWSLDISTEIPKPLYSVTKVTTGLGSIILTPAKAGYTQDETFQSTAVPDQGYMFSRWEGIASGQSNPASLSISSNSVLVAQFSKIWLVFAQSTPWHACC